MPEEPQDRGEGRRAPRAAGLVHRIDLVVAIILVAGCARIYYLTGQFEEAPALFEQDIPAQYVPRLLLWIIAILAVMLPFEHLFKPGGRAHFDKDRSARIRPMAYLTAGLLALLVASVPLGGIYVAIVAACVFLPILWGERRWKLLVPFALLFPTVVVFLFATLLGVNLEPGLLGIDFR